MELDHDLIFELQSQFCLRSLVITCSQKKLQMIQAMDYLVSLSCTISDWELHIYFIYKWFTCSKLLVSIHEKGYCDTSNELLYVHKIFLDSQCKHGYPGSWGKFEKCKKNDTLPHSLLYILNFGRCKLPFSPKALLVRVTILVSGGAKLFQANQNVKTNVSIVLS